MRPRILDYLRDSGFSWTIWLVPIPGVLYALAIVVLVLAFLRRCRRADLSLERGLEVALYSTVGAIVGTRLFYLITTGAIAHTSVREWFNLAQGTASWGAYLGAMIGLGLYSRLLKLRPWPWLDAGSSVAGLGIFVGRWACFLNGDDFGKVTSLPWAIRFPAGSYVHLAHVSRGALGHASALSLPVHPLQLVLAANGLILFFVMTAVWSRARHVPGRTFAVYWLLYGGTRFLWEFLRDPAAGGAKSFLSTSQWMCLALFMGAAILLFLQGRLPAAGRKASEHRA